MNGETEGLLVRQEQVTQTEFHSPLFDIAVRKIQEQNPNNPKLANLTKRVLEDVDRQGIDNFQIFTATAENISGVKFPYTQIDIGNIVDQLLGNSEETAAEPLSVASDNAEVKEETRHVVIFPGFALPPAGSPFIAWDIAYDSAIREILRVLNARKRGVKRESMITIVGSPNCVFGEVTDSWLREIKENGLSAHGRLYAEFIRNTLLHDGEDQRDESFFFHGMSMGSADARETALGLPELRSKIVDKQE